MYRPTSPTSRVDKQMMPCARTKNRPDWPTLESGNRHTGVRKHPTIGDGMRKRAVTVVFPPILPDPLSARARLPARSLALP